MRNRRSNVRDNFGVVSVILGSHLEIAFLNRFLVKVQLPYVRACQLVCFLNKFRQPLLQKILQMLGLDDFVLKNLVLFLDLFFLFFLLYLFLLQKLLFENLDLFVALLLLGFCVDQLRFAFLWSRVRFKPFGEIGDWKKRLVMINLGKTLADSVAYVRRCDLVKLFLNVHSKGLFIVAKDFRFDLSFNIKLWTFSIINQSRSLSYNYYSFVFSV